MRLSQRSLHNAPIFRLLLKVAVNGTHQCDFTNFCGAPGPQHNPPTAHEALSRFYTLYCAISIWSRGNKARKAEMALMMGPDLTGPGGRGAAARWHWVEQAVGFSGGIVYGRNRTAKTIHPRSHHKFFFLRSVRSVF